MVEAVGVEPTSETTDSRERSCFSQVQFVSYPALGMGKETQSTSSIDLILGARAEHRRPAYCATFAISP